MIGGGIDFDVCIFDFFCIECSLFVIVCSLVSKFKFFVLDELMVLLLVVDVEWFFVVFCCLCDSGVGMVYVLYCFDEIYEIV